MRAVLRTVGTWLVGLWQRSATAGCIDCRSREPSARPGVDRGKKAEKIFLPPAVKAAFGCCEQGLAAVLIALVIVYQAAVSPLLGRHCRYSPSCSAYFRQAVEKYGPVRGGLKGLARICRCHPWRSGGYDPP